MRETTTTTTDCLEVTWHGSVACITFPKPKVEISAGQLAADLKGILHWLNQPDSNCRAIVLAGCEQVFDETVSLSSDIENETYEDVIGLLLLGSRPVIAAIDASARNLGLCLALACDQVIASETTHFSSSFVRQGQYPRGYLAWTLERRIGGAAARRFLMLNRTLSANEALDEGLVNALTSAKCTVSQALGIAQKYATMPPLAQSWLKRSMAKGITTLDQAIETETNLQPLLRDTEDHQEALLAFAEKRPAVFKGR